MQQNIKAETPEERKGRYWAILGSILFLAGAFFFMVLGMVGKVYYDHLTKNTMFALSQIFIPLIVAPMVYGVIYSSLRSSTDAIPALILSFQNGFFWQDVFSGIKVPVPPRDGAGEFLPFLLSLLQ
jgi:hypothetical protein